MNKLNIAITIGDINGISPEIIAKALQVKDVSQLAEFSVYGPKNILKRYLEGHTAEIIDTGFPGLKQETGKVTPIAGKAAMLALEAAVKAVTEGRHQALVTAPLCKEAINLAGYKFSGHTEYLRDYFKADDVVMMFLSDSLKIGLATTHAALRDIPGLITKELVLRKLRLMNVELKRNFNIAEPHIALCALNPHAGESGLFGDEEKTVLIPAVKSAREQGINVSGLYPADTLFLKPDRYDAVLAMYHDQGMIPAKLQPGGSVNYTAGLPIVRISPDHGTAFDIAGKGIADASGMINAIKWAVRLCKKE
ncbi:4-hydroxythreonine-4-phosphate dehydrogenase PdxA [bacterium]|nr:4-hydroxythreonine-4-phosphate dehydrogenase PdxA [bacterium]